MDDHFLTASYSLSALEKERRELITNNDTLIKGTANQAATIRTLIERNSTLDAEVTKAQYDVEFLKVQGRKTRSKMKALKQTVGSLRNYMGQLLDRAERAEKTVEILRAQNKQLMRDMDILRFQLGLATDWDVSPTIFRDPAEVRRERQQAQQFQGAAPAI